MEHPEFPPNSQASKRQPEARNIHRVTSEPAARRKRSMWKRFKGTFVAGDSKSVVEYVMMDVLLPALRETAVESISEGAAKLIQGGNRRYRGHSPQSGPTGYVSYNRYSMGGPQTSAQRAMSRRARASHDFDEIILDSRIEAEEVINTLFEVVDQYDTATVADLYELVGLASSHTDTKWGWFDIRGAGVSRVRDGYLLDLPDPVPLD